MACLDGLAFEAINVSLCLSNGKVVGYFYLDFFAYNYVEHLDCKVDWFLLLPLSADTVCVSSHWCGCVMLDKNVGLRYPLKSVKIVQVQAKIHFERYL